MSPSSNNQNRDEAMGTPSSSRIGTFHPFRKLHSAGQSRAGGTTLPAQSSASTTLRGLGDISEVPSIGKGPAPAKPPKPVGLRVKKAKALSISLLTGGNTSSNSPVIPSGASSPTLERRNSRILTTQSPERQPSSTLEAALPPRSWSALDHYRENGPSKGLASPSWSEVETNSPMISKKKKLSDWGSGRVRQENVQSEELFIISKAASKDRSQARTFPSPPLERQRSGSVSIAKVSESSPASHSDPSMHPSSIDYYPVTSDRKETLRGYEQQRSVSSMSMRSSNSPSRIPLHTHSSSAALPFLNPYTAKAQISPRESASSQRRKALPTPLRRSSIIRSTYASDLERGPTSAPLFSTSASAPISPQFAIESRPPMFHARTSSSNTSHSLSSYIPLAKTTTDRTRSQSHALRSPTLASPSMATGPPPAADHSTKQIQPPPRHLHSKLTGKDDRSRGAGVWQHRREERDAELYARSSSPFGQAGALQAFGQQLGGMGVAVSKRGWDMMKNWNSGSSRPSTPLSGLAVRHNIHASSPVNEATRIWLSASDPASSIQTRRPPPSSTPAGHQLRPTSHGTSRPVFGRPLREAVMMTRLDRKELKLSAADVQLSALDLGNEFSFDLPGISSISQRARLPVSRQEARRKYLPAVVTRCVEAIENWGVSEEGIYRLSGRSSHTAKLVVLFDDARKGGGDLQLVDIGPAELDLNSVCSLLKAYLRQLPHSLLTSDLARQFDQTLLNACGLSASGELSTNHQSRDQCVREQQDRTTASKNSQSIAEAIEPLMSKLPAVNWYLLREIAYHLGDLTEAEIVKQTKMSLANLCLVLAPTLSLSVTMVRALVEEREHLFSNSCPQSDSELDEAGAKEEGRRIDSPSRPSARPSGIPLPLRLSPTRTRTSQSVISPTYLTAGDEVARKRESVATVRPGSSTHKRVSSSSVATVHVTSGDTDGLGTSNNPIGSMSRPASMFALDSGDARLIYPITAPSFDYNDGEGEEFDAPPIAARYLRKRSSSIANSLGGSSQSSAFSSANVPHLNKMASSASLYSIARQGSTMDSSLQSLPDRDSPKTMDEHWLPSTSSTPVLGGGSSSHGSFHSLGKGTGALDRPRPVTPSSGRFFSSGGGGEMKARPSRQTEITKSPRLRRNGSSSSAGTFA